MPNEGNEPRMVMGFGGYQFVWFGGPYIDVYTANGQFVHDVINVWDYERDKPVIARTLNAFEKRCKHWAEEQERF